MKYVKCIKKWHDRVKVTIGNVYTFPIFIDDVGYKINLSPLESDWKQEFKFITQEEYYKQKRIKSNNYYFY